MASRIDIGAHAKEDLRVLGLFDSCEILRYLHEVAQWENPRRAGKRDGDQWQYKTKGVVIEVSIAEITEPTETASNKAESTESTKSNTIISVLAIRREYPNI
jgi:hypothetical protein